MKDYLFLYAPSVAALFLICNLLFRCLFNRWVSSFFRIYSFFWYFVEILIVSNAERLMFLALRNMQALFSLSAGTKWVQAAFLTFFFVVFSQTICLFFNYRKSYRRLSKYFLGNLLRVNGSFQLAILRASIRPLVIGAIHSLMYNHHSLQLIMLASVELFTFMAMCYH